MNRLAKEKSPYLLQHRDNPVDWYAWGNAAQEAARRENKPIFLSIGYATCHWCHVMAHECFENNQVAKQLKESFISVKLDREERPDIDQVYMQAVVGMTGHGGWPLSVFLTPELKPFFGGTYYPRAQFLKLLELIATAWGSDRAKIDTSAAQITQILQEVPVTETALPTEPTYQRLAYQELQRSFDPDYGGFGAAPKFPHPLSLALLLRHHHKNNDPAALQMVEKSLQSMAYGGIFDHLGGGFARYATDAYWLTPHFEKMLYDNALLAMNYLETFQVTHQPFYADVARKTLDYILREMTAATGGFYSAQDADSEGEEGKFYVWSWADLENNLTADEFDLVQKVYGVTRSGNFEHGQNIFFLAPPFSWEIKQDSRLKSAHVKLLAVREQRPRPLTDDKQITAWNGLMISSMALAARVLRDDGYLLATQNAAQFIRKNLMIESQLMHRYRDGESRFLADAADYAFLIQGLLQLYQVDFNSEWIEWAEQLQAQFDQNFWDTDHGGYFYSSSAISDLIARTKEFSDSALPGANAIAAQNLLQLYAFTAKSDYQDRASKLLAASIAHIQRMPAAYAANLIALDAYQTGSRELVLIAPANSPQVELLKDYLSKNYLPNCLVAMAEPNHTSKIPLLASRKMVDGKPTFYPCRNQTCQTPTHQFEEVKKFLTTKQSYSP